MKNIARLSVSRSLHRFVAPSAAEKRIFRFICRKFCMNQSFLATEKGIFTGKRNQVHDPTYQASRKQEPMKTQICQNQNCLWCFVSSLGDLEQQHPSCVLSVGAGAEPRAGSSTPHPTQQHTYINNSGFYHFQSFLTASKGGKDSQEHIICGHIITQQGNRAQFSQLKYCYKIKKKVRKPLLSLLILNWCKEMRLQPKKPKNKPTTT